MTLPSEALSRGHSRKACRKTSSKLIELCKQGGKNSQDNKFKNLKERRKSESEKTNFFIAAWVFAEDLPAHFSFRRTSRWNAIIVKLAWSSGT